MSDDIVVRLRDCTCVPHGELCREAADEIDRLRKDRDELQKWKDLYLTFWRDRAERRDAMRCAADEIDRLRKERDELEQWINAQHPFWRLLAGRRDAMRGKERTTDGH